LPQAKIIMYATSWCGYCARARRLLSSKGAEVEEIDVDAQPAARAEMITRSKRYTVPQIFIGDVHVGGSDELIELEAAGRLDSLLNGG
jgi:glutaredoxin 3